MTTNGDVRPQHSLKTLNQGDNFNLWRLEKKQDLSFILVFKLGVTDFFNHLGAAESMLWAQH